MSFSVYQRSDPRAGEWIPLLTQQIRLRNIVQIIGLNFSVPAGCCGEVLLYYTLHSSPLSAPYYTSNKIPSHRRLLNWKEIELGQLPKSIHLSAPGLVIRVWATNQESSKDGDPPNPIQLASWGLHLSGLHYLGTRGDWNTKDFMENSFLFRMPFGFFTALDSLVAGPMTAQRFWQIELPQGSIASAKSRNSYTLKNLSNLHSVQRSVLDEAKTAQDYKYNISLHGYCPDPPAESKSTSTNSPTKKAFPSSLLVGERTLSKIRQGIHKIQLKEQIESAKRRLLILQQEKSRVTSHLHHLKTQEIDNEDLTMDLLARIQVLGREKERYKELKAVVTEKKLILTQLSNQLFRRKRELISELLLIYPIKLVQGSKKYSINEIQLPNAEEYFAETGGQISVALGYTAHLTAMLSFFLGSPLRYPIKHFGSLSRIVDHITVHIPDKEREFPLHFRSREDVYSKYAVYLLNKNIAQLRWYCGLSTSELRATLPNVYNLLHTRLTIPGWPPSPSESFEMAQELTEEVDRQFFRNESSISLDQGLDQFSPTSPNHELAIENTWTRSSYTDLECAGDNSVPSGEVKHGKAQDRFLNGWRKKTYESEEIDPKCLTNSLNLDFDAGRRLSSSSTASQNLLLKLPLIIVSQDKDSGRKISTGAGGRSRRLGRVEPATLISQRDFSEHSPNENLQEMEKYITRFERKKSFAGMEVPPSRKISRESSPIPAATVSNSRKSSRQEVVSSSPSPVDNNVYVSSPSSSPSFIRKLSQEIQTLEEKATKSNEAVLKPLPLVQEEAQDVKLNPLNLPIEDKVTFESSYGDGILIPVAFPPGSDVDQPNNNNNGELPAPAAISSESELPETPTPSSECSECDEEILPAVQPPSSDSSTDLLHSFEKDDESLWLRTAALFNPTSSLSSVIKRKSVSDSLN